MNPFLAAALIAVAAAPKQTGALLTTETAERIPIPSAARVSVDPWANEIRLTSSRGVFSLARAIARANSKLCPRIERRDPQLVLHCVSAKVDARVHDGVLEVKVLKGMPWRGDLNASPLRWRYGPELVGRGTAAQVEALIAKHDWRGAEAKLQGMMGAGTRAYAALRLGDLALVWKNDTVAAVALYQQAGPHDVFGRLAQERVCELTGRCVSESEARVFDTEGLPEAASTELELRRVRALALDGQSLEAAEALTTRLSAQNRSLACLAWPKLCEQVSALALQDDLDAVKAAGLELFQRVQKQIPTKNVELAELAADVALENEQAEYGAEVLASVTHRVEKSALREHLQKLSALYRAAGDEERALIVQEYAKAKFERKLPSRPSFQSRSFKEGALVLERRMKSVLTGAKQTFAEEAIAAAASEQARPSLASR